MKGIIIEGRILSLFEEVPNEQIEKLLASGFLADLRDANLDEIQISRGEFRKMLGLKPLTAPPAIVPPEGGRIHLVTVDVDESRAWDQAVRSAGPDTPEDYAVWRVGDQYPPQQIIKGRKEIILANFGKNVSSESVLAWGRSQKLLPATPRACFAIGEQIPNLPVDYMVLISLVPCFFDGKQRVCDVWCNRFEREAGLGWFNHDWRGNDWFAFVRE